jgi:hypothetical protein
MFDGIEIAARRIWPASPYTSRDGKSADSRYTLSTVSIPTCQTRKSR